MKMLERAGLRLSACLLALATMSFVTEPIMAQTPLANPNPNRTNLPGATTFSGDEWMDFRQAGQRVTAPVSTVVTQITKKPIPISRQRFLGVSTANAGNDTLVETVPAPTDFDAVQIELISPVNDATNTQKMTVAVEDSPGDGYNPKVGGVASTFVPVTWGTTSQRNPRNPGGGAATVLQSGFSGTSPNTIEGNTYSDIIPLSSVARTDIVGAPPLLHLRVYSANVAYIVNTALSSNSTNPVQNAAGLANMTCGTYAAVDNTSATGLAVPSATSQGYCPSVEIIYYLRGQRINTIASAGDSLQQGYCLSTVVNCSAGFVNGWSRQLAGMLTAAGNITGFTAWHYQGQVSANFNERALNGLMLGDCAAGVTHLFVSPYSLNEVSPPAISSDLKRTDHILDWSYKCGITPILVYPWAGQGIGTVYTNQVVAYIDAAKARGVPTFDGRAIVSDDGSTTSNNIKLSCQTMTAGGVAADQTHINATCQGLLAAAAFAQRATFNLP